MFPIHSRSSVLAPEVLRVIILVFRLLLDCFFFLWISSVLFICWLLINTWPWEPKDVCVQIWLYNLSPNRNITPESLLFDPARAAIGQFPEPLPDGSSVFDPSGRSVFEASERHEKKSVRKKLKSTVFPVLFRDGLIFALPVLWLAWKSLVGIRGSFLWCFHCSGFYTSCR